jgi:hypothetical protein
LWSFASSLIKEQEDLAKFPQIRLWRTSVNIFPGSLPGFSTGYKTPIEFTRGKPGLSKMYSSETISIKQKRAGESRSF